MLGAIAAHAVAGGFVTPSRIQSTTATSSTTTISPTWPGTTVAGNLLRLVVVTVRGTSVSCTTPSGWTAGKALDLTNVTSHVGVFTFWKSAAGSDASPSCTLAGGNTVAILQEWSGLVAAAPTGGTNASNTATGATLTDSITTSQNSDFIMGVFGGRSNALPSLTWGGGQVADVAGFIHGSTAYAATSTQQPATAGSYSPAATYSGAGGTTPHAALVTEAFHASPA